MERTYSEEKLESICKLYRDFDAQLKLSDSLIHASYKCKFDILNPHKKEVQKLIDKVKEHGLEDVSIFKNSITKLKKVYELK